jgi:hypothetical protein
MLSGRETSLGSIDDRPPVARYQPWPPPLSLAVLRPERLWSASDRVRPADMNPASGTVPDPLPDRHPATIAALVPPISTPLHRVP